MKLIVAILQPHQLPAVKRALYEAQILKMTITNALGAGQKQSYLEMYRGVKAEVDLVKRVRLEIGVNDDFVEPAIDAIIRGARTGHQGDGKIFVMDLHDCIRIRTGERGPRAT